MNKVSNEITEDEALIARLRDRVANIENNYEEDSVMHKNLEARKRKLDLCIDRLEFSIVAGSCKSSIDNVVERMRDRGYSLEVIYDDLGIGIFSSGSIECIVTTLPATYRFLIKSTEISQSACSEVFYGELNDFNEFDHNLYSFWNAERPRISSEMELDRVMRLRGFHKSKEVNDNYLIYTTSNKLECLVRKEPDFSGYCFRYPYCYKSSEVGSFTTSINADIMDLKIFHRELDSAYKNMSLGESYLDDVMKDNGFELRSADESTSRLVYSNYNYMINCIANMKNKTYYLCSLNSSDLVMSENYNLESIEDDITTNLSVLLDNRSRKLRANK